MKKTYWLYLILLTLIFCAGCSAEGIYTLKIIDQGSLTVSSRESLTADILLFDGVLDIEEGGTLTGSIYQMLGEIKLDGTLVGDLTQWSGDVRLGPDSLITGNYSRSGGGLVKKEGSKISGEFIEPEIRLSPAEWLRQNLKQQLVWSAVQILLIGGAALGLSRWYPRGIERVRDAVQNQIWVCLAMGALVGIVGTTLLVQMAFTIVLIPVTFLGLFVMAVGIATGWIGLGGWLGGLLSNQLGLMWSRPLENTAGAILLMLFLSLLNLIPLFGGLLLAVVSLVSLGAVFLTRFGIRKFQPAPLDP
jgi:hypothetical protein